MLNRMLGDFCGGGKYSDNEVLWRLDGNLPFADMNYHDDLVFAIDWEGGDLVIHMRPQGYDDAEEERVEFEDARIVSEAGWLGAKQLWWLSDELRIVEGGYEVRVVGTPVGDEKHRPGAAPSEAEIVVRARDIRIAEGGKIVLPAPGRLPAYALVAALHENAPAVRRAEARRRILAQPDFDDQWLMHPLGRKGSWAGCADVVGELSDERLAPFLPDLLEWIIDMSWPGAQRVFERLLRLPSARLRPALEKAEQRAKAEGDEIWLANLGRLN